jgi:integrase
MFFSMKRRLFSVPHLTYAKAVTIDFPSRKRRIIMETDIAVNHHEPWNKGKLTGQKAPLKLKDIWAIRVRLQLSEQIRDLALFNLAIDCKLRACDLVKLKVRDISHGDHVAARAIVMQQKTQRPVQFEITDPTRVAVDKWIRSARP